MPAGLLEEEDAGDAGIARRAVLECAEETGIQAALHGLADVVDVIHHNSDGSLRIHYVLTVFYGVWLAIVREWRGSLTACITVHFAHNSIVTVLMLYLTTAMSA